MGDVRSTYKNNCECSTRLAIYVGLTHSRSSQLSDNHINFFILYTVGCDDINVPPGLMVNNISSSQTHGSAVTLFCVFDPLSTVTTMCQDDGSWRPNPTKLNAMCDHGKPCSYCSV